jgi:hypothetical protein
LDKDRLVTHTDNTKKKVAIAKKGIGRTAHQRVKYRNKKSKKCDKLLINRYL